jgi:hypothetical protein
MEILLPLKSQEKNMRIMAIKVGDKVTIEINKVDGNGT